MIAIHISKNSPKKPNSKFSIYLQSKKQGISFRMFGVLGVFTRNILDNPKRVRWVRIIQKSRSREELNREEWEGSKSSIR